MAETCSFKIHPDGFNGELPHLHEYAKWKPCEEPVVDSWEHRLAPNGRMFACKRHSMLVLMWEGE